MEIRRNIVLGFFVDTEMIPIPRCVPSSLSTHSGPENDLVRDLLTAWQHIC
jgi:hypothetical protein